MKKIKALFVMTIFLLAPVMGVSAQQDYEASIKEGDVFKYQKDFFNKGQDIGYNIKYTIEVTSVDMEEGTVSWKRNIIEFESHGINQSGYFDESHFTYYLSIGLYFRYSNAEYWEDYKNSFLPDDWSYSSILGVITYEGEFQTLSPNETHHHKFQYGSNGVLMYGLEERWIEEYSTDVRIKNEWKLLGIKSILMSVAFKISAIVIGVLLLLSLVYFRFIR